MNVLRQFYQSVKLMNIFCCIVGGRKILMNWEFSAFSVVQDVKKCVGEGKSVYAFDEYFVFVAFAVIKNVVDFVVKKYFLFAFFCVFKCSLESVGNLFGIF